METSVKTMTGVHAISLEAMLSTKRAVCLCGPVSDEMAAAFLQHVMVLAWEDREKPIKAFIMSDGGSLDAGMAIYDILQSSRTPIEVNCIGKAYSIAAVLLACGRHGRYILPHSRVMIHEPQVMSNIQGKASTIQSLSDFLLSSKKSMSEILSRHTGQDEETIGKLIQSDCFFSAKDAVEFGLADGVRSFSQMLEG